MLGLVVQGCSRESKLLLDPAGVYLACGHRHGQGERLVAGQVQYVAVDSQEHHGGQQGEPIVAVDERMVAG